MYEIYKQSKWSLAKQPHHKNDTIFCSIEGLFDLYRQSELQILDAKVVFVFKQLGAVCLLFKSEFWIRCLNVESAVFLSDCNIWIDIKHITQTILPFFYLLEYDHNTWVEGEDGIIQPLRPY